MIRSDPERDDLRSELPDAPEYWRSLEARIHDDAADVLASYRSADTETDAEARRNGRRGGRAAAEGWIDVVARRAPWLVALPAAAAILLLATLPPRATVPTPAADELERLAPVVLPGELGGALLAGDAPPAVGDLLGRFPLPDEATAEVEP